MPETKEALQPSDKKAVAMPRRLSFRWKVLQVVGVALIALAVFFDWPAPSNPSIPQTSSFLLVLGIVVLGAGLIAERQNVADS